ncbi:lysylphosphatidylglycerol synthase transmembrane domain-containing protein [uncultured Bacteroides sp.]|uniref:lysylphosphatidylglycerol synthase transmembrane domain-containing protein n=1 Tax=uncultured Bacteroides sp. TaxID=162156 RepID=UPI0025A9F017|nr:lysylphosphatidylglycerol synthase transmembrane domain-containing protein [uncultured Bacteroides sp.]
MKNKYRNWFMLFGILAVVLMVCTMRMDYSEIGRSLLRAGIWFPAVLLLWLFVYLLNACSWYLIINDGKKYPIPFWKVYKLSVSGFALNYTTPCGLMGGEPYRIMELAPYTGVSKASSSVILYVMMHIFSHIWFWFLSIFLYIFMYPVSLSMALLLAVVGACCLLAVFFFLKGYRAGMMLKALGLLKKVPFLKKRASGFLESKRETLVRIDEQIALLHGQHKKTFYSSLVLEFMARLLSSLEIYFVLRAFSAEVSVGDAVLILAFSSLFSNLIFFSPMQLGAREGGLALAVGGLHLSGALGVYTGLITRVRELVWIAIGIVLIKIGNSKQNT